MRTCTGINFADYHTSAGTEYGLDFSVGSMNADTEIVVQVESSNLGTDFAHFQFVCLFTDFYGVRKLRVINLMLEVCNGTSNSKIQL
jgi:hypothetical protein